MRIAGNIMSRNLLQNIDIAQNKMHDLQDQISSNKRINKPSDDPIAIEQILNLKSGLSRMDQWKKNIEQGIDYLNTTDSVLGNISSMLQRVKELTVQAANGSLSYDERNAIKIEVDQIHDEIVANANTKVGNKAIFAGTNNTNAPLNNGVWSGNSDTINFEVGNGLTIPVTVDGKQLFMGNASNGMLSSLDKLSTALGQNNASDISTILSEIDTHIDNVGLIRASVGARVNRLTVAQQHLETSQTNMHQNLSTLQDTDMVKAIMDFKDQEKVFQAALSTGAQIMQLSLVDFVK